MKMKKILASLVAVAISSSLVLSGCTTTDKQTKDSGNNATAETKKAAPKILRVNNSSEPGTLHPGKAEGNHESWVIDHVMEGLMKKSPDGKIVPGMAKEDPKISSDGLTYTFTLRDGAKWSNGDAVTAQDFEYAWKYVLNPAAASHYAFQLYYIKGGQEYNESKETDKTKLKTLEDAVGIKAVNEKTLEVKLKEPVPYFVELMSFYSYYPVNSKVQQGNEKWANDASTYVSNGPFKLTEWKHKESIKIAKNENYYDKEKIKLDEVHFTIIEDNNTQYQMYKNGELDFLKNGTIPTDVLGQLLSSKNPEITVGPDLATYFYRFNVTKKPFNNAKVRQALSMAIDRKSIVENVAQGGQTPAYGITPMGISDGKGDYQKNLGNLFKEDVAKAKQLLEEGLKEEGMSKLSFTLLYNTHAGHKKIAEAIQDMWKKNLGVDIKLENVEMKVKVEREHQLDYEVSRAGWIGDYVDPMTFLDMWTSYSGQNDTGWKNADYDALIKKAQSEAKVDVRMGYLRDAEKKLMEQMPIAPIYFYTAPYLSKPNVKGIFKPVNRDPFLIYADIEAAK